MISEHTFSPREFGAIAFFEGKEVVDNPFCPLEIEHDDWFEGYADEVSFVSDVFDNFFGAPMGSA